MKKDKNLKILTIMLLTLFISLLFFSPFLLRTNLMAQETRKVTFLEDAQTSNEKNTNEKKDEKIKANSTLNKAGLITLIVFVVLLSITFIVLIFIKPKELNNSDYEKAIEKKEKAKFEKAQRRKLKKEKKENKE